MDIDKTDFEGEKIPKLNMCHSIEFKDTYILLQRHYNIGKGVILLYGNVRFISSNNVIAPFTSTCEESFQTPSKKRVDRSLCTLLFFTEYGCGQGFENIDYQNHQLQGCQLSSSNIINAFAAQMVTSPQLRFVNVAKGPTSAGIQIKEACHLYP